MGEAGKIEGSTRTRWLVAVWWLAAACAAHPAVGQEAVEDDTGQIVGVVVGAATGWPVAGAEVRIAGLSRVVITDAGGGFRYGPVAPGVVTLDVSAAGYRRTLRGEVVVSTGKPTAVRVELTTAPIALAPIEVRPSAFRIPAEAPTSTQRLRAEEVRRAPGAQEDILRALTVLPGVAPAPIHSNMLIVRGGAPFENLFVVEGFELPDITHFGMQGSSGGSASLLNLDFVESVDFSAGGFGAAEGDRVGSVTSVRLREAAEDGHVGEANVAITGMGVAAEGPVGTGNYLFSLRRSYLDLLLEATGESFFARYWDLNARVVQRLGRSDRLSFLVVGALDEFGFNVDTPDDAYHAALMATNLDQAFGAVTWTRVGERSSTEVTAGRIARWYDIYQNDTLAAPLFTNRSTEIENSLRVAHTRALSEATTMEVGAVAKRDSQLRYRIRIPGRLRPDAAGTPQPLDTDTTFSAFRLGSFAEAATRWTPRFATKLGVRLDYYADRYDAVRFAPRLAATFDLSRQTALTVTAGRHWQAPSAIWRVGDPGNSRLRPFRVDQAALALQHFAGEDLKLQAEAYYKRYRDYPARVWHPQAVVAPGNFESVEADVPFGLEPLASEGRGRAWGFEMLAHKRTGELPVYGVASLTIGWSEFAGLDRRYRRGAYDARVIGNLALGWKPGPLWDVGVRFRAASGRPLTPFVESGPDAGRLDLARYNEGGRMPFFHSLDVRIDRRWAFRGLQLTTYLDIQDIYNRNNPIGYYWDTRQRTAAYEEAIGFLPSLGINVEF